MTDITAVTVTRRRLLRKFEGLATVEVVGRVLTDAAAVQAAWFDAIGAVKTPWFFFIDDTDKLPANHLELLAKCIAACGDLIDVAYTDELVIELDNTISVRKGAPYTRQLHLDQPMLLHHLVLCRTDAARRAITRCPRGDFWPELLLFWELARAGAAYVPEVGYHWRREPGGLHSESFTARAQMRSLLWCQANP